MLNVNVCLLKVTVLKGFKSVRSNSSSGSNSDSDSSSSNGNSKSRISWGSAYCKCSALPAMQSRQACRNRDYMRKLHEHSQE